MISPLGSQPRMDLFAAPLEGMRRGAARLNATAENIARGEVTPENAAGLIQAGILAKANAVAVRTADEILGTLLDTTA